MNKKVVTLVRPSYSSVYGVYGKVPKEREIRPPLSLMYLASSLEKEGHEVIIIDAEPELISINNLFDQIIKTNPNIVGITSTTPEFHIVEKLVKMIKKNYPKITVVVDGAHVSALPKETLEDCPEIDYIVKGEGERAIVRISNEPSQKRIIQEPLLENLDKNPEPARHLVNYEYYNYAMPGRGLIRMDVIESSRGCPFQCTFCFNRARKTRFRTPKLVVDEIERSYNKNAIKLFMFFDDTLTVSKNHIMEICDEIIKRGLNKKIVFYANTRANTTDKEMLMKMKKAGLIEISMGVETGNPEILKAIKKGTTHTQYRRIYRWMYELNLQTRGSFIVGLPYETHKTIRETINFAKSVDLMRVSCNILTPYPGTIVYEQAIRKDGLELVCKDWKEFKRWGNSVIRTKELSKKDLEFYQKRFLTEFYTQPKVLFYHFKQLLKGNLSFFYYRPVIFAMKNRIKEFFFPPSQLKIAKKGAPPFK